MIWKNQYKQINGQSNFHEKVRDILTTDNLFKFSSCWQEVPCIDLIDSYPSRYDKYDWYLEAFNIILELHGKQHYSLQNFGNTGYDIAVQNFKGIQKRDKRKKRFALEAGYDYIEISYKDYQKLDADLLKQRLFRS